MQKSPDELLKFAKEVARDTRKPFDEILLKKSKWIEVEYKEGFLNLITKTKKEMKIENEIVPVNGWILEKYQEIDVKENPYYESRNFWDYYYVLKSNGDLNVINVYRKEEHYPNRIDYTESRVTIDNMTFLTPGNFTIPIVRVNLSDLLHRNSAYQLDVAHCNWRVDRFEGDYILRDYPQTLSSEGYLAGSGHYEYDQGEGLFIRLKNLIKDLEIRIGEVYHIKSKNSGLYLDAIGPEHGYGNGNVVGQWEYTGRKNQMWKVIKGNDNYFRLMSMMNVLNSNDMNGKTIDIEDGQNANGAKVQMWDNYFENFNQDLKFIKAEDGSYTIKTRVSDETKCLDVSGASSECGALVHQWETHFGPCQQWYFDYV